MNKIPNYYYYAIGAFLLFVAVVGGGLWLINNQAIISPNNSEIIEVTKKFIETNTNIGEASLSKDRFDERLQITMKDRRATCEKALAFVDESSKDFNCKSNYGNLKSMPSYSGTLPEFKLKDMSITNITQDKDKAIVTLDLIVRDTIYVLSSDERNTNPKLKGLSKAEIMEKIKNGEINPEDIKVPTKVETKGKDVHIKGVSLTLKKINNKWLVSSSDNANQKVGQYFSTWNGVTPEINDGKYENVTPSQILE